MQNPKEIKRIPLKEKIAYGLGDVGNNFLFDLGQIYLLKFYTDSLGIPAAAAATLFLVTKILDGFTDVAVGTWVDHRKKYGKLGKFRSFMIYAVPPLALCTAVSFYNPDFEVTGKIIWAYCSYAAFGLAYTMFNIPYGSMIPAMTKDPVERASMASFREAGAKIGLGVTQIAFIPLVLFSSNLFGEKYSFFAAAAVFAVAGCTMQMICTLNIRERHVEPPKPQRENVSLLKSYKAILKNSPLLVLSLVNLFTFSAFNVKLAVQPYFCEYVLHDLKFVSYAGSFQVVCLLVGIFCVKPLVRLYGKKATYIAGAAIWAIAELFAVFFANNLITYIVFAGIAFFGSAFTNTLNWALISDAVEYGEWKTGKRSEGVVYSFFTFFRKLSQAVAGFVPGVVLAMVGYVANTKQSPEAIQGIRGLMFIYPGAMAVATFVVMSLFYKLNDKRYKEIVRELEDRKSVNIDTI
ncbi:MAG: glycoside-pentoside-hexuronide (GPH):cation symporter [Bacteroidales bacterium]|jgi:GPH family glycoside/pentoside/hexuronide:cation symporter|nr:glycoside-pentoside-hexuronide (GPH):cation symporter [Bacteroidales bacterium]